MKCKAFEEGYNQWLNDRCIGRLPREYHLHQQECPKCHQLAERLDALEERLNQTGEAYRRFLPHGGRDGLEKDVPDWAYEAMSLAVEGIRSPRLSTSWGRLLRHWSVVVLPAALLIAVLHVLQSQAFFWIAPGLLILAFLALLLEAAHVPRGTHFLHFRK